MQHNQFSLLFAKSILSYFEFGENKILIINLVFHLEPSLPKKFLFLTSYFTFPHRHPDVRLGHFPSTTETARNSRASNSLWVIRLFTAFILYNQKTAGAHLSNLGEESCVLDAEENGAGNFSVSFLGVFPLLFRELWACPNTEKRHNAQFRRHSALLRSGAGCKLENK